MGKTQAAGTSWGPKGAAARAAFRDEVQRNPLNAARSEYRNVPIALVWVPPPPGQQTTRDQAAMRANLTPRTVFGTYRTLAFRGLAGATAWDWLMEGTGESVDHSKAPWSLVCIAVDLVSLDGGSCTLAAQYVCLPEPRWNFLPRMIPGSQGGPFTDWADPRWSAAWLGYLRDVDAPRSQREAAAPLSEEAPAPRRQGKGGSGGFRIGGASGGGAAAAGGAAEEARS